MGWGRFANTGVRGEHHTPGMPPITDSSHQKAHRLTSVEALRAVRLWRAEHPYLVAAVIMRNAAHATLQVGCEDSSKIQHVTA